MTLKDCTKEELIFVIDRLQFYGLAPGDYYLQRALCDVEQRREDQKLEKARQLNKYANEKHMEYVELISPYIGLPLCDIPEDVARQADAAQKEFKDASLKWLKLMGFKIRR